MTTLTQSTDRLAHALKWAKTANCKRCNITGFVYVVQSGEYTKVGITQHVPTRMIMLQTGNPHELQLLTKWQSSRVMAEEQEIHKYLKPWSVRGEWFKLPCDVLDGLIGI